MYICTCARSICISLCVYLPIMPCTKSSIFIKRNRNNKKQQSLFNLHVLTILTLFKINQHKVPHCLNCSSIPFSLHSRSFLNQSSQISPKCVFGGYTYHHFQVCNSCILLLPSHFLSLYVLIPFHP